nr:dna repair protein swi5 like [Quercus suber]
MCSSSLTCTSMLQRQMRQKPKTFLSITIERPFHLLAPTSKAPCSNAHDPTASHLQQNPRSVVMDANNPTTSPEQSSARLTTLQTKHAHLKDQLQALQAERTALISSATLPSGLGIPSCWDEEKRTKAALEAANVVIKQHIKALHQYNEIKDVGQGLMGMIAEKRGVRVADVMGEFAVGDGD